MFGGNDEPANRGPLMTHQASAKKQDMELEEEDDGQFIMNMLAERRRKQ